MAKLEDIITKVTKVIPTNEHLVVMGFKAACQQPEQPFCIATLPAPPSYEQWIPGGRTVGTQLCSVGNCYAGIGSASSWEVRQHIVSLDFSQAMEELKTAYPPATYSIFTSLSAALDSIWNDIVVSQNDFTDIPKTTIIKGEGNDITVSTEQLGSRQYFFRLMNDMYNDRTVGDDPYNVNLNTAKEYTDLGGVSGCPSTAGSICAPASYNKTTTFPAVSVTFYIVPKSTDFDFTLEDKNKEGMADTTDVDKNEPSPETEDQTDYIEDPETGNNPIEANDYGSSVGGADGGGKGVEVLPPNEFDYVYIPNTVPITTLDAVVVGSGILAGHVEGSGLSYTNVWVKEIVQSIKGSDTMTFTEHTKYHEAGIFNIGDNVLGLIYGETRFKGWIKSKQRVVNENEQYIEYQAVGAKGWLQTLPFSAHYVAKNKSIQWIFNDIAQYLPKAIVLDRIGVNLLPTVVIPEFTVDSATFGYALDAIMDYAREYGWYVDISKILHVYALDTLTNVQLSMPTEGAALSSTHKIISKNLNVDVSDRRTRCILRGDYPITEYLETRPVSWDVYHWSGGGTSITQVRGGVINLGKRITAALITNSAVPVYVYKTASNGSKVPLTVTYVDCNTGEIHVSGDIAQPDSVMVRYCIKDEMNPIKYDTGWKGTAYTAHGVQQVLVQSDTRFKKIIIPEGIIRDDTGYFSAYANLLLDPLKDWTIGGSILVDGLNLDIQIGNSVEILNSGCAELASTKMAVFQITWDFEAHTTSINLSNDYYLGTAIPDPINDQNYDERKQIEQIVLTRGKQQDFPWIFNT